MFAFFKSDGKFELNKKLLKLLLERRRQYLSFDWNITFLTSIFGIQFGQLI